MSNEKLKPLQRYVIGTADLDDGFMECQYEPAKHGEAVMYVDAQAREKVLVEALRRVLTSYDHASFMAARAILAEYDAEKEATDATE